MAIADLTYSSLLEFHLSQRLRRGGGGGSDFDPFDDDIMGLYSSYDDSPRGGGPGADPEEIAPGVEQR